MVVDSIKMSLRIGLYAGGIEQYWKETGMKVAQPDLAWLRRGQK